jgi:hypothetical protein
MMVVFVVCARVRPAIPPLWPLATTSVRAAPSGITVTTGARSQFALMVIASTATVLMPWPAGRGRAECVGGRATRRLRWPSLRGTALVSYLVKTVRHTTTRYAAGQAHV